MVVIHTTILGIDVTTKRIFIVVSSIPFIGVGATIIWPALNMG